MKNLGPQFVESIRDNQKIRQRLGYEDPFYFSLLYLKHHFNYPLAPFHLEMFHLIRQTECDFIVVMAFRESGKSTILNTANVLWSILGKPGKKFVVIMSKTQEQAKNHFANIKSELMNNQWLKEDFGPFTERPEEWNKLSLELEYHGAKILSVTPSESVRGMKHLQYRPDLIILDDVEDAQSVRGDSTRGETMYQKFSGELVPLGSGSTRIVVLGNLLSVAFSDDHLVLRLRKDIVDEKLKGIFRGYPLIDNNGTCLWPGKYPTRNSLKVLRDKLTRGTWQREYLLKTFGQRDDDPPHPLFYEDPKGSWEARKMMEIYEQYDTVPIDGENDVIKQIPLIRQMERSDITAPTIRPMTFFPTRDDPRYRRYMEGLLLD